MKKTILITLFIVSFFLVGCTFRKSGVCTYKLDGGTLVDASCNQLYVFFEQGYLKTPNEFQNQVLNLINEYNGKVISKSEGSEHLLVEFPNDKQIYEIQDRLKKIEHVNVVSFNVVPEPF